MQRLSTLPLDLCDQYTANVLEVGAGRCDLNALANGDYEPVFNDFTLTSTGHAFFVAPDPFCPVTAPRAS